MLSTEGNKSMAMDSVLYIDEVFVSIQGESTDTGLPCVFVRLFGCNVGCSFCDQPQDGKKRTKISIGNLISKIQKYGVKYVCITGGEPMLQWNAIYPVILELLDYGYKVAIETSGCIPIDPDPYNRSFKYVMDVKCPSSGVSHKNVYDNLMNLQPKDEVKFVISDKKDYDFMKKVLSSYPTSAKILISPCFTPDFRPMVGKELVDWLIRDRMYNVRVQIQVHKVLGVL